ncbi:prepilin-type N-terminal cleavage/methylation domain-containing protein [Pseudomonas sp. RIT-PI-a]|uniref:pilin n=1 Tax=Pseudomonas sp. RIT-PI-a TaxID=1681194 RepID=UPI0009E281BD
MIRSRNHGFTLIEVMVAIAIVGILSFLAVYMFQTYSSKAKVSAGVSELKSLSIRYDALHVGGNGNPSLADLEVNDSNRCKFSMKSALADEVSIACELVSVSGSIVGGILTYSRSADGRWKCSANAVLASDVLPMGCKL